MDHGPLTTDRSSSRFWSLVPSPWSIVLFLLLISQISFAKTPQTDWEFYQKDGIPREAALAKLDALQKVGRYSAQILEDARKRIIE